MSENWFINVSKEQTDHFIELFFGGGIIWTVILSQIFLNLELTKDVYPFYETGHIPKWQESLIVKVTWRSSFVV